MSPELGSPRDRGPSARRRRSPTGSKRTSTPRRERRPKPPATPNGSRTRPKGWRNPHARLAVSATLLIIGLATVGLGPSDLGAGITLLGATAFLYAIHRYGRLGPDEGDEPV